MKINVGDYRLTRYTMMPIVRGLGFDPPHIELSALRYSKNTKTGFCIKLQHAVEK